MDSKDILELAGNFVTTLLGVGLGAWLAFKIDRRKSREERELAERNRRDEESARRASAVNLAIHQLSRMYSAMMQFRNEVVDPMRKSPAAWYEMPPTDIYCGGRIELEFSSLQFLFSSSDPGIMAMLAMEETRFANLVLLVNRRNAMHLDQLQPMQERKGLEGSAELGAIEKALGPRIVSSMKSYTGPIIEFTDRGVVSVLQVINALRAAALPMIDGNKLIAIETLPEKARQG